MSSINKVIIVGRLGRDPEIRTTQAGKQIASMSVATSESWKEKGTGERKEKTEWHRVVIMNDRIIPFIERLCKGHLVYVEGSLSTRKWTDSNGVEKYTTEIVVGQFRGDVQALESLKSDDDAEDTEPSQQEHQPQPDAAPAGAGIDDEIPF